MNIDELKRAHLNTISVSVADSVNKQTAVSIDYAISVLEKVLNEPASANLMRSEIIEAEITEQQTLKNSL